MSKQCKQCNILIPALTTWQGKQLYTGRRIYCIECNPPFSKKFCGPKSSKSTTKTCITCNREYKYTKNSECSTCRSRKIRHAQKLQALKMLGSKCSKCGYDKSLDALDFHHIDESTKSFQLATHWHLAWEPIKREITKCVLLCANCHRELHAKK
jgi:hypothetical protein